MELPPYYCTGQEPAGVAEFFDAGGAYVTALVSSACFADWYCVYIGQGWTWHWREGAEPPPVPPEVV